MEDLKDDLFRKIKIQHILALGFVLRLVGLIQPGYIKLDGTIYARIAERFAKGDFLEAFRGVFPPVYPFLMGVFHLFVPDVERAGELVSFVSGLALIYITFHFITRLFGSRYAIVGSFFVAIHPFLVRYSSTVLSESVATFLFTLSVFFFYRGWTEERTVDTTMAGIFLGLTYLTRPEYFVYTVPMICMLLYKKKFSQSAFFLLSVLTFVVPYVFYLKAETGQWVLSQKVIYAMNRPRAVNYSQYLVPIPPIGAVFRRIPLVIFHFFEAIFFPFIILLCLGWRGIDKKYRLMVVLLTFFHIISIATQSSSTTRFSIEFVSIIIPFVAAGTYGLKEFLERYKHKQCFFYAVMIMIIGIAVVSGFIVTDKGRMLHKEAGLYLKSRGPGTRIASRLPLAPFYGKGEWIIIPSTVKDCSKLLATVREKDADYLLIDDKMGKAIPDVEGCTKVFPLVREYREGSDFVKIYGLRKDE